MKPDTTSLPRHFQYYIRLVNEDNIISAFEKENTDNLNFFESISEEESNFSYAEGKWTIKEVLQHVMDSERIFCYRALAIARLEPNVLPGFDENLYAKNSHAELRSWENLVAEFKTLRSSTLAFVKSLNSDDYPKLGRVSDYSISVLGILFTIVGHGVHHINIIKERYLKTP